MCLLAFFLSPFLQEKTLGSSFQESSKVDSTIVSAKTAFLTSEILYARPDKGSFSGELDEILRIANSTRIWSVYRPASSTHAELIIKIVEDRVLGGNWTITLYVYDPEDNRELYKEGRNFVTLSNDVTRLINHLLDAVLEQRMRSKEARRRPDWIGAGEQTNKQKAKEDYEQGIGPAQITCGNVNLYANRAAVRRVRRVLKKGDIVRISVTANEEVVVKIGDDVGYVDAKCVHLLPRGPSED
jgi:hypothetical protein